MPPRSTNTFLWVLTRMSLTVGSRNSGSSGPSPNTSSISSATSVSRSERLSGVASPASNSPTSPADLTLRPRALGLCQRFEVQAIEQLAVDVRLQLEILRRRGGRGGTVVKQGHGHGWLPERCQLLDAKQTPFSAVVGVGAVGAGSRIRRVN